MWVFLLWAVVILCVIHVLLNYNKLARTMRKIPGPRDSFIVGNAFEVLVSPEKLMVLGRYHAKIFPNLHRFWCYPIAAVCIYNPEDIETVISTMKHSEKSPLYTFMKPWLQDGLLLSKELFRTEHQVETQLQRITLMTNSDISHHVRFTYQVFWNPRINTIRAALSTYLSQIDPVQRSGEKWQQRRKILTPTFHFNILRQFHTTLEENARRFLGTLSGAGGRPTDVVPVISEFTLNSICETAMGTQLNNEQAKEGKTYKQAIYDMGRIIAFRFIRVYLASDFIFNLTPTGRAQKNVADIIKRFTKKVIHERKKTLSNTDTTLHNGGNDDADDDILMKKRKRVAMLDLLITAEKDGLIDNAGIQEEVDTFMFEGHDTTASGLTYCLMLLANNKNIQDRAAEEVNNLIGDSNRPIEMEDLANMRYLECCIKESLRMYPPVHFISRTLTEDVKLSNYDVPAGVQCHISIYDLHHREDLFPNPSKFDPDRFLPENCIGRHPYAYIPFSAGPRNCIGQKFAMLEMKLVLAEVLREFELQPVTRPEDLVMVADLVLRNNAPVYVTFAKRNKNM